MRAARLALALLLALGCEGRGSGGGGLRVEDALLDPRCTPVAGSLPSGFDLVPGEASRAALVQFQPPALVAFSLGGARPTVLAIGGIPADSDGDGAEDSSRSASLGFFPLSPVMGSVEVVSAELALVSASNYEEVLFANPITGALRSAEVSNSGDPGARAADRPFLPQDGSAQPRTAVSTRTCIYPGAAALDSSGASVGSDSRCAAGQKSFATNLTAGRTVAAGRLFVATSNLRNSGQARFNPGTVLVYAFEEVSGGLRVQPDPDAPVLFTTGFNPTGVTRHVNRAGRELVLVTLSGALGAGTGSANIRSEAAVDVIDAATARIAAVIPLGYAGPSFDEIAIDPAGRVGLLGASSRRELYGVDLAALDDARLFEEDGPPVLLDGLTTGFPDARIFDADHPLLLPDRSDGAPPAECEGYTHVAIDAAGSEAFATDYCDGTLDRVRLDLSGSPPIPLPRERFQPYLQEPLFAPLRDDAIGLLRAPSALRVRPGRPAVDYAGPDLLIALGLPDAQLCGVAVEAP